MHHILKYKNTKAHFNDNSLQKTLPILLYLVMENKLSLCSGHIKIMLEQLIFVGWLMLLGHGNVIEIGQITQEECISPV